MLNWQTFQKRQELLSNGNAGPCWWWTPTTSGREHTYGHLAGDQALQQTAAARRRSAQDLIRAWAATSSPSA
ncbi:MAG: hypothetical protein ACLSVD_02430 [Eggerthellaceae bacterium]